MKKKNTVCCSSCGHQEACVIYNYKKVAPSTSSSCGMYIPMELFNGNSKYYKCENCIHIGLPHWFSHLGNKTEEEIAYGCFHNIENKTDPHYAKYFVRKQNNACIHFEDKEGVTVPNTYYTKCGREFKKSTNANTTGYDVDLREDGTISEVFNILKEEYRAKLEICAQCPFKTKVSQGWPPVFKKWECRAGSQKPNKVNSWSGDLASKTNIHIKSLHIDFLNKVMEYCSDDSELSASYNQDLEDCRRQVSIMCSPNKKGLAAKQKLIEVFFPSEKSLNEKEKPNFCLTCDNEYDGVLFPPNGDSCNGYKIKDESFDIFERLKSYINK